MSKKLEIGIIGLGKFGLSFGKALIDHGHAVIGIDKNPQKIKFAQNFFTQVYQADLTTQEVLQQLGFADLSHVLVSVGDSITNSTMIAMHLTEMGISEVWVKAVNDDHKKLLNKIGIEKVIIPENMAAEQLADKLSIPGFIDYLPFDQDILLQEITIHHWTGKTLREIDLTNQFNIQVIAIKKYQTNKFNYVPKANETLQKGDILIIIGSLDKLNKIKP